MTNSLSNHQATAAQDNNNNNNLQRFLLQSNSLTIQSKYDACYIVDIVQIHTGVLQLHRVREVGSDPGYLLMVGEWCAVISPLMDLSRIGAQ